MTVFALVLALLRHLRVPRSDLELEMLALRQQLAVYERRGKRPRLRDGDRLWDTNTSSATLGSGEAGREEHCGGPR